MRMHVDVHAARPYAHAVHKTARSERCCSDITRPGKTVSSFDRLEADGRAGGNHKISRLPLAQKQYTPLSKLKNRKLATGLVFAKVVVWETSGFFSSELHFEFGYWVCWIQSARTSDL